MKIEITLNYDKIGGQQYKINILDYQTANGDEIELLREIDSTIEEWKHIIEEREKEDLPFM